MEWTVRRCEFDLCNSGPKLPIAAFWIRKSCLPISCRSVTVLYMHTHVCHHKTYCFCLWGACVSSIVPVCLYKRILSASTHHRTSKQVYFPFLCMIRADGSSLLLSHRYTPVLRNVRNVKLSKTMQCRHTADLWV